METELTPQYDTKKSFYKKAIVLNEDGKIILRSYNTNVAEIRPTGHAVVFGSWSRTTTRHIKEFLKQNGYKADSNKQILKDYSILNAV